MSEKGGLYYSKKTFITAYVGWEVQWFQFFKKVTKFCIFMYDGARLIGSLLAHRRGKLPPPSILMSSPPLMGLMCIKLRLIKIKKNLCI